MKPTKAYANASLNACWQASVGRFSDQPFLVSPGRIDNPLTYSEVDCQIRLRASFLHQEGIHAGDRVAFVAPKCVEQIFLFHASWYVGAIAVPVSETLGDAETGSVLRDSEPRLVLCPASIAPRISRVAPELDVRAFETLPKDASTALPPSPDYEGKEVACLIYTSGSSGAPKGVMLTHRNLLTNAHSSIDAVGIGGQETICSLLPYWHSFALVVEVVCCMLLGATVAIPDGPRDFSTRIGSYAPTIMLVVPRIAETIGAGIRKRAQESGLLSRWIFARVTERPGRRQQKAGRYRPGGILSRFLAPVLKRRTIQAFGGRLRLIVSGGAPLAPDVQRFFYSLGIPLVQGYGLTEASPVVCVDRAADCIPGSCGFPLSWLRPELGGDFTFLAEDGVAKAKNHPGELLIRGDCVMAGYWRQRDETAKSLTGGWLHTGDAARYEHGRIFIDGRLGSMIALLGGEKVHPEYVEAAIQTSPWFREVMVFGDGCKNLYAAVTYEQDQAGVLSQADAKKEVVARTTHLAPFQRPRDTIVLKPFSTTDGTLTPTLKVRRRAVWERDGEVLRRFLLRNGEAFS